MLLYVMFHAIISPAVIYDPHSLGPPYGQVIRTAEVYDSIAYYTCIYIYMIYDICVYI